MATKNNPVTAKGFSPQTIVHYLMFVRHVLYAWSERAKSMITRLQRSSCERCEPDGHAFSHRGRNQTLRRDRRTVCPMGSLSHPDRVASVRAVWVAVVRCEFGSWHHHPPRPKIRLCAIRASDRGSEGDTSQHGKLATLRLGVPQRKSRHASERAQFLQSRLSASRNSRQAGRHDVALLATYLRFSIGDEWSWCEHDCHLTATQRNRARGSICASQPLASKSGAGRRRGLWERKRNPDRNRDRALDRRDESVVIH